MISDKYEDKLLLYNNFLAFMTDSCSLTDHSGYVNSSLAENLPSMEEYFSGNLNYPLYVDMRTSAVMLRETVRIQWIETTLI